MPKAIIILLVGWDVLSKKSPANSALPDMHVLQHCAHGSQTPEALTGFSFDNELLENKVTFDTVSSPYRSHHLY